MIDKWKLFQLMQYECHHPEVRKFHNSTARVKVCVAPRRTTKSYGAAHDVLPDLFEKEDCRGWIVGPSYSLAEKEFRYIHEAMVVRLGMKPRVCRTNSKAGQLYMEFPNKNGTRIVEGKSADRPDSLLGEAVDWVIYSEAAELARGIRERYVAPTLNTRRGREIVPTTPQAKAEWVYELWEKGADPRFPEIEAFHWDRRANPLYDEEEFQRAKKFYGANSPIFREQYLGEWVFYGGLVYPSFSLDAHIIKPFNIPPKWRVYRGIDFGHRDPFVCLWAAVGPEQELYLFQEYYNRMGASMPDHAKTIKDMSIGYNIYHTVGDPSSKQAIEDLSYHGVRCDSAQNDLEAGRFRMAEYLSCTEDGPLPFPLSQNKMEPGYNQHNVLTKHPRFYIFNTCKESIREFKFYRWKEGRSVQDDKEKTEGEDHAMDAARYIVMERPSPVRFHSKINPHSFKGVFENLRRAKLFNAYIR